MSSRRKLAVVLSIAGLALILCRCQLGLQGADGTRAGAGGEEAIGTQDLCYGCMELRGDDIEAVDPSHVLSYCRNNATFQDCCFRHGFDDSVGYDEFLSRMCQHYGWKEAEDFWLGADPIFEDPVYHLRCEDPLYSQSENIRGGQLPDSPNRTCLPSSVEEYAEPTSETAHHYRFTYPRVLAKDNSGQYAYLQYDAQTSDAELAWMCEDLCGGTAFTAGNMESDTPGEQLYSLYRIYDSTECEKEYIAEGFQGTYSDKFSWEMQFAGHPLYQLVCWDCTKTLEEIQQYVAQSSCTPAESESGVN